MASSGVRDSRRESDGCPKRRRTGIRFGIPDSPIGNFFKFSILKIGMVMHERPASSRTMAKLRISRKGHVDLQPPISSFQRQLNYIAHFKLEIHRCWKYVAELDCHRINLSSREAPTLTWKVVLDRNFSYQ